jgi:hypothetical protein
MKRGEGRQRIAATTAFLGALVALVLAAGPVDAAVSRPALLQTELSREVGREKAFVPPGFTVKASNGFSMYIFGSAANKGRPASIGIFATGRSGGAIYSAPATVTENSIQADLGALGEIAVTFQPSGQTRTVRSKCGGKSVSFDSGYYEGKIDFHGEEGYAAVEATRAAGGLGLLLNILCPGSSGTVVRGPEAPFLAGAELDIFADGSRNGPHVKVVKNGPRARAHFEAGISETVNGVAITRVTGAVAEAGTFEYDSKVKTATVHPPSPFSGTGKFRREAKPSAQWTGDLTVDFPGKAGVKLTGGKARVELGHAHWDWHGGGGK